MAEGGATPIPICPFITQSIVKWAWAFMGIGINVDFFGFMSKIETLYLQH